MSEVCVWLQTIGSCGHDLTGPWREVAVTCWHHADRKQITDWPRFSSPGSSKAGSQTDKQETMNNCKIYQQRWPHTETHACTHHMTSWDCVHDYETWFMTKEMLALFSFVRSSPKWAYCFTICRKKIRSADSPLWPKFITFPTKCFLIKKLDGNKGPYSVLAIGILSAALQHRCLEIMMHTGTHLNNSRVNHQENS